MNVNLVEASDLSYNGVRVASEPAVTGKIVKMNRKLDGGGWIWIDAPAPSDGSLIGQHIFIENDNERDATYRIHSAESDGELTKLYCGPISFVRGFAGPTVTVRGKAMPRHYDKGFLYDFEEGSAFRIPLHRVWRP